MSTRVFQDKGDKLWADHNGLWISLADDILDRVLEKYGDYCPDLIEKVHGPLVELVPRPRENPGPVG